MPRPPQGRGGRRQPPPRRRDGAAVDRREPAKGVGGEQVEGRHAVRELLLAGRRRVKDVWMAEDMEPSAILDEITELAGELRVSIKRVSRGALETAARSDAPQGVLAHAQPIPEVDLDRLVERRDPDAPTPFLICLDGITDPQNLGALLRTAECSGATGVVLPRHRSAHVTPTVAKAAAGAVEHLPVALVGGMPSALARLKELGVWTVGLDGAGDSSIFELNVATEPIALVFGAEGRGLSRLVRDRCDVLASIPLRGALASLNVSAAAAVACYEVARRRQPL
ncbi:MAG: rRNA (guanosine2251-2-O)-methyltransferase [Actinomycetota bacterium]|nr:rRNA (guanosine2251-2-O)-methyltransferase [Actinomycetota bacterium]